MRVVFTIVLLLFSFFGFSQTIQDSVDDGKVKKAIIINNCTPKAHLQCVYLTTSEVYEEGRNGKRSRHWWRMSYIGRACTDRHGKGFGKFFEAMFAIPHYTMMAMVNGVGLIAYVVKPPKDKIRAKKKETKASIGS